MTDFTQEEQSLRSNAQRLEGEMTQIDRQLHEVLSPELTSSRNQLQDFIRQRTAATQAEALQNTIRNLGCDHGFGHP